MIYRSDRDFQLWDYTVGHAQLLLRSPATSSEPYNLDLVFLGVEKLDIPTRMAGLTMTEPRRVHNADGSSSDLYQLTSGNRDYFVVAAAYRVYKNQHDLTESSLEYFSMDEQKDPGEVVSHSGLQIGSTEVAGQASA